MALKNYFSEEVGYELFDLFSKKSPKYNKDEVLLKWYDIKPRLEDEKEIITIGSIYYWAEQDHPEEYSLILNDDSLLFSGKLTTLDIVMYSFIKQCFSFQEISNYLKSLEPKMVQYKENINFKTSSKSIVFYLYERFWNNDFLWIGGVLALMGGYSHLKQ